MKKDEFDREDKEEVSEKRIGEEENEENDTGIVKRRCANSVSIEAFDIFRQGEELESCGNSWRDLWDDPGGLSGWMCLLCVLDVTDVHPLPLDSDL